MDAPHAQSWLTGRELLRVVALRDISVEATGHHPCSNYVELFYLHFLGPAALVTARHLSAWLEVAPGNFTIPTASLARQLGLGTGHGRNAPLTKTLFRLVRFGLAEIVDDAYGLRLAFPPLRPGQVRRLPRHLAELHHRLDQAHPHLTDAVPGRPGRSAGEPAAGRVRSGRPGPAAGHTKCHLRPEEVLA